MSLYIFRNSLVISVERYIKLSFVKSLISSYFSLQALDTILLIYNPIILGLVFPRITLSYELKGDIQLS